MPTKLEDARAIEEKSSDMRIFNALSYAKGGSTACSTFCTISNNAI